MATAAGLAAAEVMVGLVEGSASPVVPVGQEFIDRVPRSMKDWAIEQFGTNDKVVLVSGALIVVLALGATVGIMAIRGSRAGAYALTSVIGIIGAFAVLTRPAPTLGKLLPTIVGTAVSIAVLWYLGPKPVRSEPDGAVELVGLDRRTFMVGLAGVGSAAVILGGFGRLLQRRFEVDSERAAIDLPTAASSEPLAADTELGVEGISSFVTPNSDFYRIDTALVVPQVSKDSWKLTIDGLVDNPLELTFDDLLARPQIERYVTLSCVSNEVGGDLVGNALWQGVLLKDILEEAGLQPGAEQLASRSADGWTCGTPLDVVMDGRDAMLAVAMNGEPLPAQHGYPVRMVVPGLYGYVSATKWVTDLRLTTWEDFDGYWIPRGWSKLGAGQDDGPHRHAPQRQRPLRRGRHRWRGLGGPPRDRRGPGPRSTTASGSTPNSAGVPSNDTWAQWVYRWTGAPGPHLIEARAIDKAGEIQPEEPAAPAPDGAQGYHRIRLHVTAP